MRASRLVRRAGRRGRRGAEAGGGFADANSRCATPGRSCRLEHLRGSRTLGDALHHFVAGPKARAAPSALSASTRSHWAMLAGLWVMKPPVLFVLS